MENMSKNLKTMSKEQLARKIDLIEQDSMKKSRKHNYIGYYLQDEYCEKPDIYKQAISGMGDASDVHFIAEVYVGSWSEDGNKKVWKSVQFYWCGICNEEPYRVEKDELVEIIWKIIQRDYQ